MDVRGIDFFLAYQQFFVVSDGQCTATIQTQYPLCARRQGDQCQVDDTEYFFHFVHTFM